MTEIASPDPTPPAPDPTPGPAPGPASGGAIQAHPIAFTGDGGVYFGVWIVNLLLSLVTLGIYTPWARRRTIRYFYGHTFVAGSPLEFTAGIRAMVFGFLLFAALYIAFNVAGETGQSAVVLLILVGTTALAPWLWGSAMRFRLGHTRWRGLRLRFAARWGEVYRASWPVFAIAAVWLATGLALEHLTDAARAQQQQEAAAQAEEASDAQEADADEAGADEHGDEESSEDSDELEAQDEAGGTGEEAGGEESEAGSEDEDAAPDDEEPLPRPTWRMGAVLLAGLLLSFLCFVRLEFNYKRLLVLRTGIGGQTGRWKPEFGDFVRIWLTTLGVFLLGIAAITASAAGVALLVGLSLAAFSSGSWQTVFLLIVAATAAAFFAVFLAAMPALAYREARMFRLVWNNIGLGQVARFRCELRTGAFVWLRIKNILLGMITFGLYRPFARVAEYRMKAESVTLHVRGDLELLVGKLEAQEKEGFGDAVADALGLDLIG